MISTFKKKKNEHCTHDYMSTKHKPVCFVQANVHFELIQITYGQVFSLFINTQFRHFTFGRYTGSYCL